MFFKVQTGVEVTDQPTRHDPLVFRDCPSIRFGSKCHGQLQKETLAFCCFFTLVKTLLSVSQYLFLRLCFLHLPCRLRLRFAKAVGSGVFYSVSCPCLCAFCESTRSLFFSREKQNFVLVLCSEATTLMLLFPQSPLHVIPKISFTEVTLALRAQSQNPCRS